MASLEGLESPRIKVRETEFSALLLEAFTLMLKTVHCFHLLGCEDPCDPITATCLFWSFKGSDSPCLDI